MGSCVCFLVPTKRTVPFSADQIPQERIGDVDPVERLIEIDDVDAVALTEDKALHLRVPAPGLVTEMNSGLEQLPHGDDSHVNSFPSVGRNPMRTLEGQATATVGASGVDTGSRLFGTATHSSATRLHVRPDADRT